METNTSSQIQDLARTSSLPTDGAASEPGSGAAEQQRADLAAAYAKWPSEIAGALRTGPITGRVGGELVSETDRVRVWHIHLAPGERLPFHRHVLDYFWTSVSPGRALSYYEGGAVREFEYRVGDIAHFTFDASEEMVHNLVNIGPSTLSFVTVEFKQGANQPLQLEQRVQS